MVWRWLEHQKYLLWQRFDLQGEFRHLLTHLANPCHPISRDG
jgi:hypothetical protein